MIYNIFKPWETLDPWQIEYINKEGNCFLLCGRQSGKTTAASIKFGDRAVKKRKRIILMLAFTEKQAYNLFFKTLMYLRERYPNRIIEKGAKKPTKHIIHLVNGSIIMCYAAGLTGEGIRTYTVTDLVIDEAAPMAREVFIATMPMLSVTKGNLDILSTPRGKEGFFYECSKREDFTKFYVNAEDCPRHEKGFLEAQKSMMSKLEYAQEYQARFLDDLKQFFSDDLIKENCILERRKKKIENAQYFSGSDIAGMGTDETVHVILDGSFKTDIRQVENIIKTKQRTTQTTIDMIELYKSWKFKKMGMDDGGMGVGVYDQLLDTNGIKNKIVALNNASRDLDRDGKKKKRILKEDMYNWLLKSMEMNEIKLLNDKEIMKSLKSVQYEYLNGKMKIFGNDTHIAEALIRAVWLIKTKGLKLFAA